MKPVVAIVGRPNVGKSSLFNRLTRTHKSIIDDEPGVTRDRIYGEVRSGAHAFLLVDTGGFEYDDEPIQNLINEQVQQVLDEADLILFIVDAQSGVNAADEDIAELLRRSNSKTVLVVNKAEGIGAEVAQSDFAGLRLGDTLIDTIAISARRGDGLERLMRGVIDEVPYRVNEDDGSGATRIALIGRPNVGKSTLTNAIAGENRVLVLDMPGTTRDSVEVNVAREDGDYVLIDTAGVRRKGKIDAELEKLSVVKSLQAIDSAHVVLLILDAKEGVVDQDCALAGLVARSGKSFVVAFNKWDGLTDEQKYNINLGVDTRLSFLVQHERIRLAAKFGTGVGEILRAADRAHASAFSEIGTGEINRILQKLLTQMTPPRIGRRPIRIKYGHQGGMNPPNIVIHGNRVTELPATYQRYLTHAMQRELGLIGTPVKLSLRDAHNPYDDKDAPKKRPSPNRRGPKGAVKKKRNVSGSSRSPKR